MAIASKEDLTASGGRGTAGPDLGFGIDRYAVLKQLDRLLASEAFRKSKRLSDLLHYVVTQSLDGRTESLKERMIGVRVFGRNPDYDTGSDAIVRVSCGDLRKRIAQYYHEPGHSEEIRIDFPAGSYHPVYRLPLESSAPGETQNLRTSDLVLIPNDHPIQIGSVISPPVPTGHSTTVWFRWRGWPVVLFAVSLLSAYALGRGARGASQRPALDRFWAPLLGSSEPVLILNGGRSPSTPPAQPGNGSQSAVNPVSIDEYQRKLLMSTSDALTLVQLANMLGKYNKPFDVQYSASTDLTRVRKAPLILIGAFNNEWTGELTQNTRFYFAWDRDAGTEWVADRNNNGRRDWQVSNSAPYDSLHEDYAIVGRFLDPATEHPVVLAGGLKNWGTRAAGEFLTNQAYMDKLMTLAPKNWKGVNVEAVIATRIINGVSGPPQVAAVEFW